MKKAILHTLIASTLALLSHQAFAAQDDVNLRMSWWGGNGRHQVTLKALEEFHKQHRILMLKRNIPVGMAIYLV